MYAAEGSAYVPNKYCIISSSKKHGYDKWFRPKMAVPEIDLILHLDLPQKS